MAVIRAQSTSGVEPEWFGLAPIEAVRKVAERAGWGLADVDLFESNEAFAVQALAVLRDLDSIRPRLMCMVERSPWATPLAPAALAS